MESSSEISSLEEQKTNAESQLLGLLKCFESADGARGMIGKEVSKLRKEIWVLSAEIKDKKY